MMGNVVDKISIEKILEGMGVKKILTVDPFHLADAVAAVRECAELSGVKAIIFKSPCVALAKPKGKVTISDACIGCKKCIREIGCPALMIKKDGVIVQNRSERNCVDRNCEDTEQLHGRVTVDASLCTGCGLCAQICPVGAIGGADHE